MTGVVIPFGRRAVEPAPAPVRRSWRDMAREALARSEAEKRGDASRPQEAASPLVAALAQLKAASTNPDRKGAVVSQDVLHLVLAHIEDLESRLALIPTTTGAA